MSTSRTIAQNIREAREMQGLSQNQAAKQAGIGQPEWVRFEGGERRRAARWLSRRSFCWGMRM
jgi:transcriptional regulator with XRE-family HTH domain